MVVGAVVLFGFYFGADWLARRFALPVSGPVLGMALLTIALAMRGRTPQGMTRVSDLLLKAMPLFFIPAGVGVMVLSDPLRTAWMPMTAALLGSTLLALATTALVMKGVAKLCARSVAKPPQ